MTVEYTYHSLEDFLVSSMLTVDAQLDDGWGASFPVKGREIDATVLFADITAFSSRTLDLSPAETLIFVNNFFGWISAEALRDGKGIVDKYIGDELMIVFSREFGSEDPFVDALQAARWMADNDALGFVPHVGLASGLVMVGYVGTPIKYNCSVFGSPVALAARCAGVKPEEGVVASTSIVFPAAEWGDRRFEDVFPPQQDRRPDGEVVERPLAWELLDPREVPMKNLPSTAIREVIRTGFYFPQQSADDRAREGLEAIKRHGRYRG
jgi:class 3 adenylate cyclase